MGDVESQGEAATDAGSRASWKWLGMVIITGLILYLLVSKFAGGPELLDVLRNANWMIASLALGLIAFNWTLAAVRWNLILRAMGFNVPYLRAFRVMLATRPFDLIAPSRSNDLLRPIGLRDVVPVVECSGSVIAQRVIDVQSLCVLAIVGGALCQLWSWAALAALSLLGGWVVLVLLFWKHSWFIGLPLINRFDDKLRQLAEAFVALAKKPGHLVLVSLVSLTAWLTAVGIVFVLSKAFGAELDLLIILALWPLAIFVGMLPLTIAGMGTRDAAFVSLIAVSVAQPPLEAAILAVTFGYSAVASGVSAIVGLPFMLSYMNRLPDSRKEQNHEEQSNDD